MSHITVIGTFHLREGQGRAARQAFQELAEQSLHEDGCESYVFHEDVNDPRTVVGVEQWTSKEALDAHMQQPYVAALVAQADTLLDQPFDLQILTPIDG